MKHELAWLFGSVLLLTSCSSSTLPIAQPPMSTTPPSVSGTVASMAETIAIKQTPTAMESVAVRVDDWVMKSLPRSGPKAGVSVEFDQKNSRIVITANPQALAEIINGEMQVGEPVLREQWPLSLSEALADQDPSIEVELIPGIVIITDTLQITDTVGK